MTDYTGLALVISAVLTPLSIIYVAWLNNRNTKRVEEKVDTVETKVATVETKVEDVQQTTTLINHAVNGKDPRQSTLSEDVITIKEKQELDLPSEPPTPTNGDAVLPLLKQAIEKLDKLVGQTE